LPKNPIAATKMAMWATQQPQRGGTTSHRTIYLTGIDAKWQGREGFRAGGSGL